MPFSSLSFLPSTLYPFGMYPFLLRLRGEIAFLGGSAVARVSEAPPEISRGAPHTLLAYYYELQ